jgi:hypothetical protein
MRAPEIEVAREIQNTHEPSCFVSVRKAALVRYVGCGVPMTPA